MSLVARLIELQGESDIVRARALLGQEPTAAAALVARAAGAESADAIDHLLSDFDTIREMLVALQAKL